MWIISEDGKWSCPGLLISTLSACEVGTRGPGTMTACGAGPEGTIDITTSGPTRGHCGHEGLLGSWVDG